MAVTTGIYSDLKYGYYRLANGDVSPILDANSINQSLLTLFSTRLGERFFNPLYGTNIQNYLFEPFTELTANSIIEEVQNAVTYWEGDRVQITSINITMNFANLAYNLVLQYTILSTPITATLNLTLAKA